MQDIEILIKPNIHISQKRMNALVLGIILILLLGFCIYLSNENRIKNNRILSLENTLDNSRKMASEWYCLWRNSNTEVVSKRTR